MRQLLITWFTMAMAYMAWPAIARAEQPKPTLVLEVDVSALPRDDETEGLRFLLVERQTRILQEGGIAVVESDSEEARIRVTVSRYGEGDLNYRFTVMLLEGEAVEVERTLTCDLCRDTELVTKVSEEVARVSGRFLHEREAAAGAEPGIREGGPAESQPGEFELAPRVRRVGGAGWAGIGLAAAGVGFGVGGAVELAKPATRELSEGDYLTRTVTEPRLLGSTLLGVGIGLIVGGAVLTAIDQTTLLERRRRRARQLSLTPSFSATGVCLSLSGRF